MSNPSHALFIVDASHSVEEQLLHEWVQREGLAKQFDIVDYVRVPIAADPENVPLDALKSRLQLPGYCQFIPIRVVWRTSLDQPHSRPRFRDLVRGNSRHPSRRKASQILAKDQESAQCVAGESATLEAMKADFSARDQESDNPTAIAEYIANRAALALHVAERRLRGSRYRTPRRVEANLLANPEFRASVKAIANEENTTEDQLLARAQTIFKELIPKPSSFGQDSMEALNRQIVSLGYDKEVIFDREKVERLKQIAREKPCVLLWTHKTHVDGFAFASLLFQEDFPATHTLGGVNMAFAGLGFLARKSTAIFIRRSFSDDKLYRLILRHYLGYLLEKRFPLSWAFEGTRSRVGKLMPPRYGILKYVLEAAKETGLNNLQIVPVALNYDLINDVSDYVSEQQGAIKTPESLRWFISYLRRFKSPHGKIYLDFGEPITVDGPVDTSSALDLQKIAFQVGVEANRASPLTLTSLLCMHLLGIAPRALTRQQCIKELYEIVRWARERNIPITDTLLPENDEAQMELGSFIVESGLITLYDQGPDSVFGISEDKHGIANYYRNTIVHHFVVKSIAELALLRVSDYEQVTMQGFWNQVDLLRDSFKFEFFYNPSDEFRMQVDEELNRYDTNWQSTICTSGEAAAALLRKLTPHFAHTALLPFIEAYAIVAGIFARLDEGETIELKDCVNQALKYGKQLYLQNRVRSQSSIGKLLFENGYKLLESRDLVSEKASREDRRAFSRELWAFSHRISTIRAMASPADFDF